MRRTTLWGRPRMLATLCVAVMSVGLVACGDSSDDSGSSSSSSGNDAASKEAAANASKCGLGNGQKATGDADQARRHHHEAAGHGLHRHHRHGQGRTSTASTTTAASTAGPSSTSSRRSRPTRSRSRRWPPSSSRTTRCSAHRRQHEPHRLRRQPQVLRAERLNVIAAGVARECYFDGEHPRRQHGPVLLDASARRSTWSARAPSRSSRRPSRLPAGTSTTRAPSSSPSRTTSPARRSPRVVPINDGAALALKLVQAAGDGGGVVLNFMPPEALKVLQGAEQQGLIDKVKWACATPCNDASIAQALGPAWNDKLGINAELNLVDSNGPGHQLYLQVHQAVRARRRAIGSFGQMGFVARWSPPRRCWRIKGDVHEGVRQRRLQGAQGRKTDILCKPWTSAMACAWRTTRTARSCRRTTSSSRRRMLRHRGAPSNNLEEQRSGQ